MSKHAKKAAKKATRVEPSEPQAGAQTSEFDKDTPPTRRVPTRASDENEKPPVGDHRGDKDPAVFEWYCVNRLAEAKRKYIGRTLLGRIMREPDIDRVHSNGGLPDSVKRAASKPATTGHLGEDTKETGSLEMPEGAVITE